MSESCTPASDRETSVEARRGKCGLYSEGRQAPRRRAPPEEVEGSMSKRANAKAFQDDPWSRGLTPTLAKHEMGKAAKRR